MTNPFIVVLEGPDGAGKSTIAKSLIFQNSMAGGKADYVHNNVPPSGVSSLELYQLYMKQLKVAVFLRDHNLVTTIIDRSFLSETIYGPLYRGRSLITGRHRSKLERYARRHNITLLAVQAPLEIRRQRIAERNETYDFNAGIIGMKYEEYFETHKVWKSADSVSANRTN